MRKTKIIATLGPASDSVEQLKKLFDAGCNVVRINMSHSSQSDAADMIARVRTISESVAILVDTRGPEVRTTAVDEPIDFVVGQAVRLSGEEGLSTSDEIRVNYPGFVRAMEPESEILVNDGRIHLRVISKHPAYLDCEVTVGGRLTSKKGVNVPGVKLPMPFLSEQDRSEIRVAVRHPVDFIAASFVSEPEDVLRLRELIDSEGGQTAIISKIEARFALKNLTEIIAVSDGLMVARGDLGVEIPAEEVPIVQKQIIDACRAAGKTVIVATEMLESMISNPRQTRAETSDVANAIFEGTDAIMLSGETSVGKYPIQAVEAMSRIARVAENEFGRRQRDVPGGSKSTSITELMCKGAWLAAKELNIKAILVPTSSGTTAKRMSRYRPNAPILATTPSRAIGRKLCLSYGVYSLPTRHYGRMENMIRRSCQLMLDVGWLTPSDHIAVVCGVPVGRSGNTNLMTSQEVGALTRRVKDEASN